MNNNTRIGRQVGTNVERDAALLNVVNHGKLEKRHAGGSWKRSRGWGTCIQCVYTVGGCSGGGGEYDIKTPLQRVLSTAGRTPTAEFSILTTRENAESFNLRKHALKINGDVTSEKRSRPNRFYYNRSRVEVLKRNKVNSLPPNVKKMVCIFIWRIRIFRKLHYVSPNGRRLASKKIWIFVVSASARLVVKCKKLLVF